MPATVPSLAERTTTTTFLRPVQPSSRLASVLGGTSRAAAVRHAVDQDLL